MIKNNITNIIVVPSTSLKYKYYGSSLGNVSEDGETLTPKRREKEYKEKLIEKTPAIYKLNKQKVRAKIAAWKTAAKSNETFKFITVTFPINFPDNLAKKCLNTWLTRIRKIYNNFTYVWVAERQKNGTLHFHLITTQFLPVKIINYYMAKVINNCILKNELNNINYCEKKYNGVDIRNIYNMSDLTKYITKYITKNYTEIEGCVWNCSENISKLYTSEAMTEEEFNEAVKYVKLVNCFIFYDNYSREEKTGYIYASKEGQLMPKISSLKNINKNILYC